MRFLSHPFTLLGLLALTFGLWVASQGRPPPPTTAATSTTVSCQTTKGPLQIVVVPSWSPRGAERFLQMVKDGFYSDLPLFRCIDRFICQFGAAPPRLGAKSYAVMADDPARPELRKFKQGYVSFAGYGPNSRSTHLFITLVDGIESLGTQPWETPIGYVTEATMTATASHFTTHYGEISPPGTGPELQKIEAPGGAEYVHSRFPDLDWFQSCQINK